MASEPYWAAAPSRSTSICRSAMDGNRGDVRALRPVGYAVADPGDDRAPVPALAVDQHQRVVRGEAAQVGGTDDPGRVAHRLRVDVEGGDQRPQLIPHVGAALTDDVLVGDGVYRDRRRDHRSGPGPAADHDHLLLELRPEHDVQRHRAGGDGHPAPHVAAESGQRERHVVGGGRQPLEHEAPRPVGYDGPRWVLGYAGLRRTAGNGGGNGAARATRFHRDAGEDEARRIGHGAREGSVPCGGCVLRAGRVPRADGHRCEQGGGKEEPKAGCGAGTGSGNHPVRRGRIRTAGCAGCIRPRCAGPTIVAAGSKCRPTGTGQKVCNPIAAPAFQPDHRRRRLRLPPNRA